MCTVSTGLFIYQGVSPRTEGGGGDLGGVIYLWCSSRALGELERLYTLSSRAPPVHPQLDTGLSTLSNLVPRAPFREGDECCEFVCV